MAAHRKKPANAATHSPTHLGYGAFDPGTAAAGNGDGAGEYFNQNAAGANQPAFEVYGNQKIGHAVARNFAWVFPGKGNQQQGPQHGNHWQQIGANALQPRPKQPKKEIMHLAQKPAKKHAGKARA